MHVRAILVVSFLHFFTNRQNVLFKAKSGTCCCRITDTSQTNGKGKGKESKTFVCSHFIYICEPSLFSCTILPEIRDTEQENYLKRFVFHVSWRHCFLLRNFQWLSLSLLTHDIRTEICRWFQCSNSCEITIVFTSNNFERNTGLQIWFYLITHLRGHPSEQPFVAFQEEYH